jgi:hypothetical protein
MFFSLATIEFSVRRLSLDSIASPTHPCSAKLSLDSTVVGFLRFSFSRAGGWREEIRGPQGPINIFYFLFNVLDNFPSFPQILSISLASFQLAHHKHPKAGVEKRGTGRKEVTSVSRRSRGAHALWLACNLHRSWEQVVAMGASVHQTFSIITRRVPLQFFKAISIFIHGHT